MTAILRLPPAILLAATLLGVFVACDGSAKEEETGPFVTAIRHVPAAALAGQPARNVSMIDLAGARAAFPATDSTGDPFVDTLKTIRIWGPETLWAFDFSQAINMLPQWRAAGIDPDRFDLVLETGVPPQLFSVAFGSFDADRTVEYLRSCEGCPEPEMVSHGGTEIITWGDPRSTILGRAMAVPLFDNLGRGGAIAVTDKAAIRTFSVPAVSQALDATQGKGAVLGEDDDFVLLAGALDNAHALNAYISDAVDLQAAGHVAGGVALVPYSALAVGQRLEGDDLTLVIALAHPTADAARENAGRLQQRIATATSIVRQKPWTELFPTVETSTDGGRIVVATLRGPGAGIWPQLLLMDPLLLFER